MNAPIVFLRRNNVKKSVKKNYTHIFGPRQDPNPRTSKMFNFCVLAPKLTWPRSCVDVCAIIVGVIQNNFLCQISNLWLKLAHVVISISLICSCSTMYGLQHIFVEQRGNEPLHNYDLWKKSLPGKLEIRRAEKFFSSY